MWAKQTELTSATNVMPIDMCEIKKMGCGGVFFYAKHVPCSVSQQTKNHLQCYNTSSLISYNVVDGTKGSTDFVCQHLYASMT